MDYRTDFYLFLYQYFMMWYHSCLTLRIVEVSPRTTTQLASVVLVFLINAIFNGILFGIYFGLINVANRAQNEF